MFFKGAFQQSEAWLIKPAKSLPTGADNPKGWTPVSVTVLLAYVVNYEETTTSPSFSLGKVLSRFKAPQQPTQNTAFGDKTSTVFFTLISAV